MVDSWLNRESFHFSLAMGRNKRKREMAKAPYILFYKIKIQWLYIGFSVFSRREKRSLIDILESIRSSLLSNVHVGIYFKGK